MKRRADLIISALEYYRGKALSDKELDMCIAELSDKQWSRDDIKNLLHEYADIGFIIQKIKEADEYTKKVRAADTDNDISVNKYNMLYFLIADLLR